jgi:GAF domain-containing protein
MPDPGSKPVSIDLSMELESARQQADAAQAETEVLRKAMKTLARHLRMDHVLDSLLRCLLDVVPYDLASVILTEDDESGRLFVAWQLPQPPAPRGIIEFEITDNPFVQQIVHLKKNISLADTKRERDWRPSKAFADARCWIGVPLLMDNTVLGLLSIGSTVPRSFTKEHVRLAKLLALPVAVSVHHARLREWVAIYAADRN